MRLCSRCAITPLIFSLALTGFLITNPLPAQAQAKPALTRRIDVQAGGSFDFASPDYGSNHLYGFGAYATADFTPRLGMELSFHQLFDPNSKTGIYERTYEVGPRYVFHLGRISPYAKFLVGRGVFQFPPDPRHPQSGPVANLAFTIWTPGIGTDFRINDSLNFRADYEFQQWPAFPPHGLTPRVFSIGIAYHFR